MFQTMPIFALFDPCEN